MGIYAISQATSIPSDYIGNPISPESGSTNDLLTRLLNRFKSWTVTQAGVSVPLVANTTKPIVTAAGASVARRRVILVTDSANTTNVDICFAASATSATRTYSLPKNWVMDEELLSPISAISTAAGNVQVTVLEIS